MKRNLRTKPLALTSETVRALQDDLLARVGGGRAPTANSQQVDGCGTDTCLTICRPK